MHRWTVDTHTHRHTLRLSPEEDEGVLKEDGQAGTHLLLWIQRKKKKKRHASTLISVEGLEDEEGSVATHWAPRRHQTGSRWRR